MKQLWNRILIFFGVRRKPSINSTPVEQPKPSIENAPKPEPLKPVYPNWPDRRPLGMVMLASAPQAHEPVDFTNYRWKISNEVGPVSKDLLKKFLDRCIEGASYINAQGLVFFDPELQMFPHQFSFIGDPRLVPAQYLPLIDWMFEYVKSNGLKIGLCIRPDIIKWIGGWPHHFTAPDPVQEMIDKIEYAHNRWVCTMFYIDSNIWPRDAVMVNLTEAGQEQNQPPMMDASAFEKLAKKFPDFLLMPEHQDLRYYEFTAPYNNKDYRHSIALEKSVHPNAFQVLDVGYDVLPPFTDEQLKESVKEGNILMGRVWFQSTELEKIKQAYES